MLAIPMFRIPDVNDTNAQLPPSQNSPVAASLLLACSAAGDLQATLQILNAVYYASKVHNMPKAVEIARLFTPKDINDCRKMLEQLAEGKDDKGAAKGDANAMTLHGKFLELAGNKEEARYFYEKALERYNTKMFRGYPHPMALPWLTPWTELVNLEETSPTPSIEKMSEALKFGAMKADDPMAYYKLATLQDTKSPEWLKYMSKAAASGHPEAMYRLGQFYHEVNARPSDLLNDAGFKKVLKFLTSWKRNASADFGMEWLKAAAMGGHKPAMLEMAQLYEQTKQEDAIEQSMDCLKAIVKEPPPGVREEWPHLVMQARQRLAGLQRARKDQRQFA
jgi:TPR repeat protein